MLAQALEDHRPGWGVDPHGKGLSGEQHFDEASAEEHLHHLLHDWQQPYRIKSSPSKLAAALHDWQQPYMQKIWLCTLTADVPYEDFEDLNMHWQDTYQPPSKYQQQSCKPKERCM